MRRYLNRSRPMVIGLTALLGAGIVASTIYAAPHVLASRPVVRVALPAFTRIDMPRTVPHDTAAAPRFDPVADPVAAGEALAMGEVVSAPAALAPATDIARPGRAPLATARERDGIIPLDFDLQHPSRTGETVDSKAISVRKMVRVGGREIGSLPIRIDGSSRLLVDAAALRSVLTKAGVPRETQPDAAEGMVSFSDLRRDGLDLRYDPNSDSVVIDIG